MRIQRTMNLIVAAMCAALCVVLPMAFHAIPNAGSIFLPMHIPRTALRFSVRVVNKFKKRSTGYADAPRSLLLFP